jgi:single-stranded DNA-binding protein
MTTTLPNDDRNEVHLRGRLAATAELRELPSGDILAMFRVTVSRPAGDRVKVDSLDCVSDRAKVRRALERLSAGDVVEIEGSLRRRFLAQPERPGQPVRGRRQQSARGSGSQSWSASRRITSPDAGFGVNSVDLRGIRPPAAATAATAATGVGRSSTANPP